MDETLMEHQIFIDIDMVRCRIDASLILLMTTLMNHQCDQCVLDWGTQHLLNFLEIECTTFCWNPVDQPNEY